VRVSLADPPGAPIALVYGPFFGHFDPEKLVLSSSGFSQTHVEAGLYSLFPIHPPGSFPPSFFEDQVWFCSLLLIEISPPNVFFS